MIDPSEAERISDLGKREPVIGRIQERIRTVPGFLAHAFRERSQSRELDGPAVIGAAIEYVQTRFANRGELDKAALREAFIAGHTACAVTIDTEAFEAHFLQTLPPTPEIPDAA